MANEVVFYISAASDMAAEREILGRSVAEVPVDLPWRIVQSPAGNGPVDLDAVIDADIHIIMMGGDIRAPIGLEWQTARRYGRRPIAFLKTNVLRTPAGRDFIRLVREVQNWVTFDSAGVLRRRVLLILANYLLDHATNYALTADEMNRVRSWKVSLEDDGQTVDEDLWGGAGDSAILISRERFEPSDGIVIDTDST